TGFGVGVVLEGGDGNTLVSNWIGIDLSGNAAGNATAGVLIQQGSSGNLIGAGSLASRNVISGNPGSGIAIGDAAGDRNVISGNGPAGVLRTDGGTSGNRGIASRIGTNAAGTSAVPNASNGVAILGGATQNTVGGMKAAVRNVISGNALSGVAVSDAGTS